MSIQQGDKHFTATVWIVTNDSPKKVLLLHHKKYNFWLPPGGHIERHENPAQAAIREVKEETGLVIDIPARPISNVTETGTELPLPYSMREFLIPERGDEPEHYHLDVIYRVEVPEQSLTINDESHNIDWFTREEAEALSLFESTRLALAEVLKD
ncbi:hypothetical protein A2631_04885 [Candidatus Daviesbacteria bacterium RIFCSPHIGHO2_01_FULL_44_29]|uniref:Nudix hydrolase domain-containing protein n=1 Tax=Candidatus Daviesbacteria bacterium RIFCSPHIGHO2_02_FULL_43_12 TaxID=1797776 RepID=A0A1F5KGK1_9BACT|nr:MAG: hypothetical protein A2631_04885 [Candidatus Daviesbacteria bacterium RIFCSPHIGHO2_01_FULL_44_29]OGE40057.1 MAG: hypothetical protein A3D25_04615 [Candidatus Daviesbacteria bacterium RIFCSPHIGHO2_02_FULL_43_12]OGE41461.1 MAG: hypothetical protein A3E86_05195 [Candidatus Daviesbacteria bacterium RIFCSPHIGHO2_12_FULL_47_45]OGE70263.1 MAG: hypothetical protein A3B55_00955 [Candidatus Daviesbacteria bacterium RIFCSPLOWO2_01_FULL_43_15]